MAGGKETPRQKMIGMMYLVLTALLALNVSKEILDSFIIINDGLENTNETFGFKNSSIINQFEQQMAFDPQKTRPHFLKAKHVAQSSEELIQYVDDLKRFLIAETEGYDNSTPDSLFLLRNVDSKDNYDTPTHLLIGPEPGSPKEGANSASELKEKIEWFRDEIVNQLDPIMDKHRIENINRQLAMSSLPKSGGGKDTWETGSFYHVPLAACITNLTKIQSDIRNVEAEALNSLFEKISINTFKFDTIEAKVVPKSSYVLQGEPYTADVFLAAYSKTEQPLVMIGVMDDSATFNPSDTLIVENGLGKLSQSSNEAGLKKVDGIIRLKKVDGTYEDFQFHDEFIVAAAALTVAPTKMNVFYKGVKNPVDISVPGVANENVEVSITGGNRIVRTGDGEYEVTLNNASPRNVEVNVTATLEDGTKRPMGSKPFRVKYLPKPYAQIGDVTTTGRMSEVELVSKQGIRALYDKSFEFGINCVVKSFDLETRYRGNTIQKTSSSNLFTSEMQTVIRALRPETQVVFKNIEAEGSDGIEHSLNPIIITII